MSKVDVNNLQIQNNQQAHRWEAQIGQHFAVANYQREGNTIYFISTEVPQELEGQGIASKIVRRALDDARAKHFRVVPYCPFVTAYIQRHPEYQDLLHPDFLDLS